MLCISRIWCSIIFWSWIFNHSCSQMMLYFVFLNLHSVAVQSIVDDWRKRNLLCFTKIAVATGDYPPWRVSASWNNTRVNHFAIVIKLSYFKHLSLKKLHLYAIWFLLVESKACLTHVNIKYPLEVWRKILLPRGIPGQYDLMENSTPKHDKNIVNKTLTFLFVSNHLIL